jgi:hypothetical protein
MAKLSQKRYLKRTAPIKRSRARELPKLWTRPLTTNKDSQSDHCRRSQGDLFLTTKRPGWIGISTRDAHSTPLRAGSALCGGAPLLMVAGSIGFLLAPARR